MSDFSSPIIKKPMPYCMWLNKDYLDNLNNMINKFSLIAEAVGGIPEGDKYRTICQELLNHKARISQILKDDI